MKKECLRCKRMIDCNHEQYVLLATYEGKKNKQSVYFHFNCWRLHFDEKARQKAEAVMKGATEKIMPIAQGLFKRLKEGMDN